VNLSDRVFQTFTVLFLHENKYYLFAMKIALLIFALIFSINKTSAQTAKDFAADWDKQHVSSLPPSNVRHKDLQKYLEQLKRQSGDLSNRMGNGRDKGFYVVADAR
jgi:hypothetical protein